MLTSIVVSIVRTCTRFATLVVIASLLLAAGACYYAAEHFAINTDINKLISPDLDWRKRDNQFEHAFDREKLRFSPWSRRRRPNSPAPRARRWPENSQATPKTSKSVQPLGSGEFFEKNGLLFLPVEEVAKVTGQLEAAAPLIEIMAGDPSIRGLTGALETGLAGVKRGQVKLDNTERPFNLISQTVEDVLNKGTATFSWRGLVSDTPLTRCRPARLHRVQAASSTITRSNPARMRPTRSGRPRPISKFADQVQRAGAADRPGSDRE